MDTHYFIVVDGQSVGPLSLTELMAHPALNAGSLVWKSGMPDWKPASEFAELSYIFGEASSHAEERGFKASRHYDDSYGHRQPRQPYGYGRYPGNDLDYRPLHTNWLPWSIVATVVGFFTSCIGAVFGIIGIVQANKANTYYARGMEREGDACNSTAKIMTIIGLILAGIGIVIAGWFSYLFRFPVGITNMGWV